MKKHTDLQKICQKFRLKKILPPPKFNIAPEKWCLEDKPFLLGPGNFSGSMSMWNFGRVVDELEFSQASGFKCNASW